MVIAAKASDPRLDHLVASIVDRVRPELVLLFGSRGRGDAKADSDYDLMIVVHDGEDAENSRKTANEVCFRLQLPVDILASTASDYLRRQNDPGFLDWLIAREGRCLYSTGLIPQRSPHSDRVREQPSEGVDTWIERAEEDFHAAVTLLGSANPAWAATSFHAHACVEKLLKALIVSQGTFPPRTHGLATLLEMVPTKLRNDRALVAACKLLQDVYPKSRYHPNPLPTPDEANRAVEAARAARDRLLKQLGPLR